MATAKKPTKWKIDKLQDNPRQAQSFPEMTDVEQKALAADMQRNDLQHPIEITSDGTIIAGHQRVRAAKKLGWTEIEVIVRTDLESQGCDAIERRLIEDNLNRRHLDPLSVARCLKALDSLYKPDPDPVKRQARPDLLDAICQQLQMSPKNASRYLHLLKAPLAVQYAFSRGELPLVLACRVAGLSTEQQQQIAVRITAGEESGKLVKSFLRQSRRRQPDATDTYLAFFKLLNRLLDNKPQAVEEISVYVANESAIDLFQQTIVTCQQLIRWTKAAVNRKDFTP